MKPLLLLLMLMASSLARSQDMAAYLAQPEPDFTWQHYYSDEGVLADHHFLRVTSQRWLDEDQVDRSLWHHEVTVSVPRSVACPGRERDDRTALVLISGGDRPDVPARTSPGSMATGLALLFCRPVVDVRQVPNQPLQFIGETTPRREDSLLARSMTLAVANPDGEWPLHNAMVKTVIRSLDAVQAFSLEQSGLGAIDDFALLGSSKRGWTAWLVAAHDPRIRALIPVSIDMLNLGKQFDHQYSSYGVYTPALNAFSAEGIDCLIRTMAGKAMLNQVDPYAWRDQLTLPKLIINASGDPYFVSDSWRFYYPNLAGSNWLRYTPNTGHSQGDGFDRLTRLAQVANWLDQILAGETPPSVTSKLAGQVLEVIPSETPREVVLWQAHNSQTRDFRLATLGANWMPSVLKPDDDGIYRVTLDTPQQGYRGWFVEVRFGGWLGMQQQIYTSGVHVRPDAMPYSPRRCASPRSEADS
ncbi:PhoPQ-activated protein PqaA family protein [Alcanivorax sp. DP30]|uniref:PhoPQ-activated protein PqaA family protein n=1 Tax=Alcanivorax sp. DP30 TaxID=2606217 RepID=UPI00136D5CF2|nr:PhoPQ-activated protein PqaA family protein [Alcanivorax sp. DP30]MZR62720.1 hypothetical protein [Alcanivorax sp. DP30]